MKLGEQGDERPLAAGDVIGRWSGPGPSEYAVLGYTRYGKLRMKAAGHREQSRWCKFPRELPGNLYVKSRASG